MKNRIKELAIDHDLWNLSQGRVYEEVNKRLIRFAKSIHNEAMELAAKECDCRAYADNCGRAIRELKV